MSTIVNLINTIIVIGDFNMTRKTILLLILAWIPTIQVTSAGATSSSASVSISVNIPERSYHHGQIHLQPLTEPADQSRLSSPLPPGFLPEQIEHIAVVEPIQGSRALAADQLWIRGSDALLHPLDGSPPILAGEQLALEYHAGWRDLPGTYAGKLIVKGSTGLNELDITIEIPPFVHHEVRGNRLSRDTDGNLAGGLEVLVTSNARQWSLTYRVETPTGQTTCNDVRLAPANPNSFWEITDQGSYGVIIGRGAVHERLLVLQPHASTDTGNSACDAVVVIEDVSTR